MPPTPPGDLGNGGSGGDSTVGSGGDSTVGSGGDSTIGSGGDSTIGSGDSRADLVTLHSVTPRSGAPAGGTNLVLRGDGFLGGSTVNLGAAVCTVATISDHEISCTTTAHQAGYVDVTVVPPAGASTSLVGAYRYVAAPTLVAGGSYHTCALVEGSPQCWGQNWEGQLGDGTFVNRSEPVPVVGLPGPVVAMDAGKSHTCAIVEGASLGSHGGLYCWGQNYRGQLGDTSGIPRVPTPVAVLGLDDAVAMVVTGSNHTCAALETGELYCWGANDFGEVGDATLSFRNAPTLVDLGGNVVALAAGEGFTCATTATDVKCWGSNYFESLADGSTADRLVPTVATALPSPPLLGALGAGYRHACAQVSGELWCWGRNEEGDSGTGDFTSPRSVPGPVVGLPRSIDAFFMRHVHACALAGGSLYCWGRGDNGTLGDAGSTDRASAQVVSGVGTEVSQVAVGDEHTCVLADGEMLCWGLGIHGELGNSAVLNMHEPQVVPGLGTVQAVAQGPGHTCAVSDGDVWCWGDNQFLSLGNTGGPSSVPVGVAGVTGVQRLALGLNHSCAATTDSIWCWGNGWAGQLGSGVDAQSATPQQVLLLGTGTVDDVSSHSTHTCAAFGGQVQCWGENSRGQLGDGTTDERNRPVVAGALTSGATHVAAGLYHSCAVVSGAVWCWGDNGHGQLGDGSTGLGSDMPIEVPTLGSAVTLVAAGSRYTCAVAAGAVWCWGQGEYGQLGDGLFARAVSPTAVTSLSDNVTAIAAAANTTCAIRLGELWCWGENKSGQAGVPDLTRLGVPTRVAGVANVDSVAVAESHVCAVSAGTLQCWGWPGLGQLGTGGNFENRTPTPIVGWR